MIEHTGADQADELQSLHHLFLLVDEPLQTVQHVVERFPNFLIIVEPFTARLALESPGGLHRDVLVLAGLVLTEAVEAGANPLALCGVHPVSVLPERTRYAGWLTAM